MPTDPDLWFLVVGTVLMSMALAGSFLKRLWLSAPIFYLAVGFILGSSVTGLLTLEPLKDADILERVTEIAVLISLFTTGLKLRLPLTDPQWSYPIRLASVSMILTIGLVTMAGVWGLGLPIGAAVLLGAVVAPTDPVLAAGVQVTDPSDQDKLRFALTGEAGLNDGTAFPFVLLGLGLLGVHDLGPGGWRWWVFDLGWMAVGGLSIGTIAGTVFARLILHLRLKHRAAIGREEFLAFGLISLCYGLALLIATSGFLAVFAAGVALRRLERLADVKPTPRLNELTDTEIATQPETAPLHLAHAVLGVNEMAERVCEVFTVVIAGSLLATVTLRLEMLWFIPALLFVFRPVAVYLGLLGTRISAIQITLIGWFGMRGIGSLYYLAFAASRNLPTSYDKEFTDLVLATVAASIILHGISVNPLMDFYRRRKKTRRQKAADRTATSAIDPVIDEDTPE